MPSARVRIVAADHPSLDAAVAEFLTRLGHEPGVCPEHREARDVFINPRRTGARLAAFDDDRVVGLVVPGRDGGPVVVVDPDHRDGPLPHELTAAASERSGLPGEPSRLVRLTIVPTDVPTGSTMTDRTGARHRFVTRSSC